MTDAELIQRARETCDRYANERGDAQTRGHNQFQAQSALWGARHALLRAVDERDERRETEREAWRAGFDMAMVVRDSVERARPEHPAIEIARLHRRIAELEAQLCTQKTGGSKAMTKAERALIEAAREACAGIGNQNVPHYLIAQHRLWDARHDLFAAVDERDELRARSDTVETIRNEQAERIAELERERDELRIRVPQLEHGYDVLREALRKKEKRIAELEAQMGPCPGVRPDLCDKRTCARCMEFDRNSTRVERDYFMARVSELESRLRAVCG